MHRRPRPPPLILPTTARSRRDESSSSHRLTHIGLLRTLKAGEHYTPDDVFLTECGGNPICVSDKGAIFTESSIQLGSSPLKWKRGHQFLGGWPNGELPEELSISPSPLHPTEHVSGFGTSRDDSAATITPTITRERRDASSASLIPSQLHHRHKKPCKLTANNVDYRTSSAMTTQLGQKDDGVPWNSSFLNSKSQTLTEERSSVPSLSQHWKDKLSETSSQQQRQSPSFAPSEWNRQTESSPCSTNSLGSASSVKEPSTGRSTRTTREHLPTLSLASCRPAHHIRRKRCLLSNRLPQQTKHVSRRRREQQQRTMPSAPNSPNATNPRTYAQYEAGESEFTVDALIKVPRTSKHSKRESLCRARSTTGLNLVEANHQNRTYRRTLTITTHPVPPLTLSSLRIRTKKGLGKDAQAIRIKKVLGEGSQATVYIAQSQQHELFALKRIRSPVHVDRSDPDVQRVLHGVKEQELLHICADKHPNVVSSFNAFQRNGRFYILMEYMNRGTLVNVAQRRRQLHQKRPQSSKHSCQGFPEDKLQLIALQVLRGLAHLHRVQVFHRDIKPSNLLTNDAGEVKIGDFGIVGDAQKLHDTAIGSVPYMSPERLKGEWYDAASDIWSFGLTMAELALGQYPFGQVSKKSVYELCDYLAVQFDHPTTERNQQQRRHHLVRWELLPTSHLSETFIDFVEGCLRQNPRKRPTASSLLLHPFLAENIPKDFNSLGDWFKEPMERESRDPKKP